MIDFKTNYLKTLVRELCEKKDGDEILLDVFYVILDHYKQEGLLESNSHLQRHIQFLEKIRNLKKPIYRQTQLSIIGKVAPYLYKRKKKAKMKVLPNKCGKHKPKKLGYIQWFLWAEEQTKKGKKQSQCPICGYWFFPQEM